MQHLAHELLAQLVAEQPLAGVFLQGQSPYTQLYLTHIDEQGRARRLCCWRISRRPTARPIFRSLSTRRRAASPGSSSNSWTTSHMRGRLMSWKTAAMWMRAIKEYQRALSINPKNVHAHQRLGYLLYNAKRNLEEGLAHTTEALRLNPNDACAHFDLGMALRGQGESEKAVQHLAKALELMPEGFDRRYNPVDMHNLLGEALVANGERRTGTTILTKAVSLNPKSARAHYLLALALAAQGLIQEPAEPLFNREIVAARH